MRLACFYEFSHLWFATDFYLWGRSCQSINMLIEYVRCMLESYDWEVYDMLHNCLEDYVYALLKQNDRLLCTWKSLRGVWNTILKWTVLGVSYHSRWFLEFVLDRWRFTLIPRQRWSNHSSLVVELKPWPIYWLYSLRGNLNIFTTRCRMWKRL